MGINMTNDGPTTGPGSDFNCNVTSNSNSTSNSNCTSNYEGSPRHHHTNGCYFVFCFSGSDKNGYGTTQPRNQRTSEEAKQLEANQQILRNNGYKEKEILKMKPAEIADAVKDIQPTQKMK